ncbi:MAG: caspase family protein [Bacteroidota bacterium]|nr:caspase family protein [Bacteroidota bacterium]
MKRYFVALLITFPNLFFAQQPKLMLPVGHTATINSAEFSPDGKKIVTASRDHTAKIWDAVRGKLLVDLKGHTADIVSAEFSPDGKKIVTAASDSTAMIWDAISGELLVTLNKYTNKEISSARFSPVGKNIVTGSWNSSAAVWDASNGQLLANLTAQSNGGSKSAQFSPDGKKIITISPDSTGTMWDGITYNHLATLKGHAADIESAEFSPDSKKAITASDNGAVKIWDVANGHLLLDIIVNSGWVMNVQFSPDQKKIVTSSLFGPAVIWDALTGKMLVNLNGDSSWAKVAWFSPDGKKIVTVSMDKLVNFHGYNIKIWDAGNGKLLVDLGNSSEAVMSAMFSPDGKKIISTLLWGPASIWNGMNGNLLFNLSGHTSTVKSVQYSPDSEKIITLSGNGMVRIWDDVNGKLEADLAGLKNDTNSMNDTRSAQFYPGGKKILTYTLKEGKIWDAVNGKLLVGLKEFRWLTKAHFSTDGKKIITNSTTDPPVRIWDADNGSLLDEMKGNKWEVYSAEFSPDGSKIVTASRDSTVRIWDAANDNLLVDLKEFAWSAMFSPDGEKILTISKDSVARTWDVHSGKLLFSLKERMWFAAVNYSPDGKKIASTSGDTTARIWDATNGKLLVDLKMQHFSLRNIQFSPDGKKIIGTSETEGIAKIWDANNGNLLFDLATNNEWINNAVFSPGGKKILVASGNFAKVLNADNGKLIYSFLALDSSDYLYQIPSGYYMCTQKGAQLLYYVKRSQIISFEQLDIKYNRPDKVLEAIGNTDTALIKSYRKAWEKRIKKLGIDTTAFRDGYSVPEADFVNRDNIEYEQKDRKLTLHIRGIDSTYKLDRFNIWVNEVPVYGQRGISIRKKNRNDFDTIITIKLSQGENRIETSITNVNGTESYRIPLRVKYTLANPVKESTRFIGIGIDQFADNKYNLQYSAKDIRDLAARLKEKYGTNIIIDTLFNQNVTVSNVKLLKTELFKTNENDKVIIAYSGHGMLSKDYDYYLSTYAVNFDKPEENGLPYDELENLLDSIPARKKLMLIDACHSGEVDKEDLITLNASSDSLIKGLKPIAYKKEGHLGLKNSFELMQSLFVNVGKSTGATIISAAAGTQFALERNDLKNGVFTYSILEAMNKYPSLKISELKKIVGERVEELTNGLQKPTSRTEMITMDWSIW